MPYNKLMRVLPAMLLACLLLPLPAPGAAIDGIAFVRDDGSLSISGTTVRLYGILIPETAEDCYFFERPVPCGPRAVLALKFDIGTDFVHCETRRRGPDGSHLAVCRAGGRDLAAELLRQGWAAALPGASYRYRVLETIAHGRRIGVWGIPVVRGRTLR